MTPAQYRAAHPRLYGALIARHGGPNAVQLAAAAPLTAGRDVLLCAPTASGKTEAVLVPLVERHLPSAHVADTTPRLLLVSPTRALVNDLARRLAEPLAQVGVAVGRWTGDHHDAGRLQPLTVLTPEALDARLARSPGALAQVGALVLDELHVVDGGVRGDQLRILVQRLREARAAAGGGLQVVGASATVAEPARMAGRYLVDPAVLTLGARRPVRARIAQGREPAAVVTELLELARQGFRKVLAFCDSREEVETLARHAEGRPPFGGSVFAHHGSLARRVRLSAEARFRTAPVGLCVATSTLEVGLDIGDVDLVALVGPPPDVASLLQRIGRGGRRLDHTTVVAFVAGPFEALVARTLLDAQAKAAWLQDPPLLHPGVLVQQAVVLAASRAGGVHPQALWRRLPSEVRLDWPEPRLQRLLVHACDQGWLLRVGPGPTCVLGPRGERLWARGEVHANLGARRMVTVVDGVTGDAVGEVAPGSEDRVSDGARGRRALHSEEGRVVTEAGRGLGLPSFGGGAKAPMHAALARALLHRAGVPAPCRARLDGGETVFHGLGSAGGALLARTLRSRKVKVRHAGPLAVVVDGAPFSDGTPAMAADRWPAPSRVALTLDLHHPGLARDLGLGAFHGALPEDEQRRAVAEHSGAARVEALLALGLPPAVEPTDPALWDQAAWS
jgi:ATP-dependent Lhr-like helicase